MGGADGEGDGDDVSVDGINDDVAEGIADGNADDDGDDDDVSVDGIDDDDVAVGVTDGNADGDDVSLDGKYVFLPCLENGLDFCFFFTIFTILTSFILSMTKQTISIFILIFVNPI